MNDAMRRAADAATAEADRNMPFPAFLQKIGAAGIERYHADLMRGEKTYYDAAGHSHVAACAPAAAPFATAFSAGTVRDAVRTIQRGEIGYQEFCARIAAAGCVAYLVSLPGRRAVYYGRTAETYVEMFPGAD